jgi:two-component system, OmpR family, response regulator
MSDVGGHDRGQEMARGLGQNVSHVLDESTPSRSVDGARQMAQTFSLHGLDRLLGALAQYAHDAWPSPLRPVVERLQRAAAECARSGQVDVFRRMDDELGMMARAIERVPLARSQGAAPGHPRTAPPQPEATAVPLADVLEGMPTGQGSAELLRRVSLRPSVAGALRAALDWLVGGSAARMRMWLSSDGSALDVICEGIAYTGIQPAADVLTSVGAHLGPTGERPGAWTVRVPICAERETYLMLEQDELQIAVPWHAVVRVRLIPTDTVEMMLRRQALPVLAPLAVSSRRMTEQPVVVVALGLKRACLVADRLVWRMSAESAAAPGAPPAEGIGRVVRSDDGEQHWVLEPSWLLRSVAAPVLGQATSRGSASPGASAPTSPAAGTPVTRAPIPFPDPTGARSTAEPLASPLAALGPESVEALEVTEESPAAGTPGAQASLPEPATEAEVSGDAAPLGAAEAPAAGTQAPRRALVAEDSIAARIYLVRLLEQQGFDVHAVATAAELQEALAEGPWTLICADGGLPDGRGGEFLSELVGSSTGAGPAIVALVADADEESAARAAGVRATLRKPFDREALDRLLDGLAPDVPAASGGSGTLGDDPDPREWGAR